MGEGIPQKASLHLVRYAIGWGFGGSPWGFWGFVKSHSTFFNFLVVSITYWELVLYKESRDGGLGDMRNPHELAFCVMLHSSSCFLVSITYWESTPYKDITGWGFWGFVKSHSTLFGIFLLAYF